MALGKREIKRFLKTRDHREAKSQLPLEMLKARAALDEARRKLAVTETAPAILPSLTEDELWGLMSRWFVRTQQQDSKLTFDDIDLRTFDRV